ncbi:lycopene cyclase domain-containing protein [Saccharopolyspora karakumensis]|uniref:Lycopene cyclase domain-containing protein n=2 Tax=Saccharopolyspora karakumensis TaxID=2530386 RepID=A0A4R5BC19_9PSEU|nr:lycopene cyclase domain-containing protein [Saccharopolyspora karakumensis]
MAGCLLVVLPLECLGARVLREPGRTAAAVLPVALLFLVWDAVAVWAGVWSFNPRYTLGVSLTGIVLEEFLFFLIIPLCALLTYQSVEALTLRARRTRGDAEAHR